jgi:hypothetical protein
VIDSASDDFVSMRPSLFRASAILIAWLVLAATLAYLREAYFKHHWWTENYALTLVIRITFFLLFIGFTAVPQRLEFSASEFRIKFLLGRLHSRSWDELDLYG